MNKFVFAVLTHKAWLCILLWYGVAFACLAQDSIDDLFDNQEDAIIEVDAEAVNTTLNIEELTGGPSTIIGGSFSIKGGLGLFLNKWPWEFSQSPTEVLEVMSYSVGYGIKANAFLDVRPNSYTRFYTTVLASLNASSFQLTTPALGEMFLDYTFLERISFRLGKFGMTWGQGGILANPGNLVARAIGGAAVRAFIPLGANGLGFVTYATAALGGVSPRNLAYAVQYDTVLFDFVTGVSAHYRYSENLQTVAYIKRSINLLDLSAEVRLDWANAVDEGFSIQPAASYLVANAFYEFGSKIKWRFGVEYYLDNTYPDWTGHFVGAGLVISNLPWNGWRPGVTFKHAFLDNSGEFSLGFDGPIIPGFSAVTGINIKYGSDATHYRPSGSKPLGLGFEMTMSYSF